MRRALGCGYRMKHRFVRYGLVAALLAASACRSDEPTSAVLSLPRLELDLPAGWQAEAPTSTMRAAQARISGPGGEAELTVFHFGEGKGGGIAENLQRWVDQIEFGPGSSTHREEFTANGYTIYWVDFQGTLKAGQMGMAPALPVPNARLLGAVIEGPGGPWYLKATGPDATLAPQRDAFLRMLESVRARP